MDEKNNEMLREFIELVKQDSARHEKIIGYLKENHAADIAELLKSLEDDNLRRLIFFLLEGEKAAEVIKELEDAEYVAELLKGLDGKKISEIFEEMFYDDAADFIGELPEEEQERFLDYFEENADDVQKLIDFGPETAGGLMTTEYVSLPAEATAEEAINILRKIAPEAETVYYLFVVDQNHHLVGVISLRELIIAKPEMKIAEIMHKKVISVQAGEDQEEVARLVSKYNFLAIPVVDAAGILLGIITVDDVIDVIDEEATEDIYRMAGTNESESEEQGRRVFRTLRARIPWLLVTLVGGICSGQVMSHFALQLDRVVALTFFIPLLIGMAGNVGTQSSTVTVRGIAIGDVDSSKIMRTIGREALVGASLGLVMGGLISLIAFFWQESLTLGLVVGLAMLTNIFAAATMGTLVPLTFKKMGIDPAIASAPFITTSIDVLGLLIYISLASILLQLF